MRAGCGGGNVSPPVQHWESPTLVSPLPDTTLTTRSRLREGTESCRRWWSCRHPALPTMFPLHWRIPPASALGQHPTVLSSRKTFLLLEPWSQWPPGKSLWLGLRHAGGRNPPTQVSSAPTPLPARAARGQWERAGLTPPSPPSPEASGGLRPAWPVQPVPLEPAGRVSLQQGLPGRWFRDAPWPR